jgi:hypothetical protein
VALPAPGTTNHHTSDSDGGNVRMLLPMAIIKILTHEHRDAEDGEQTNPHDA